MDTKHASEIRYLVITQESYYRSVGRHYCHTYVAIPDTISRFTELETISISAFVKEVPPAISQLPYLKLLDLSGCYDLLHIPQSVLKMPNLTIKIGAVISLASSILILEVPWIGITSSCYSVISSPTEQNIHHLIIDKAAPKIVFYCLAEWEEVGRELYKRSIFAGFELLL